MYSTEHKVARPQHEVLDLIAKRWSPRSFQEKAVEREKLLSVLEAARWAPSGFNEQPWRFIIGDKYQFPDHYKRIFDCINEWNQAWAHSAPLLMIVCGVDSLMRNGNPNPTYAYDTGQSVANLTVQANAMGLYVHQMGGFHKEKAIQYLNLPSGVIPIVALALGYLGNPDDLENEYKNSELAPRSRKSLSEISFSGVWGESI